MPKYIRCECKAETMALIGYLRDLRRIQREEGTKQALQAPFLYVHKVATQGSEYQTERRVDLEQRWNLMQQNLSREEKNLIDIGCAEGELTERFSKEGLFCIGVDVLESRLSSARRRQSLENDVRFINYEIKPSNIDNIPSFDVVLLLTVYYHWCRDYGQSEAEYMYKTLASKSNKIFFQPPDWEFVGCPFDESCFDSVIEGYKSYLADLFDNEADIEYIGTTEYRGDDRKDPLFVIKCDNF